MDGVATDQNNVATSQNASPAAAQKPDAAGAGAETGSGSNESASRPEAGATGLGAVADKLAAQAGADQSPQAAGGSAEAASGASDGKAQDPASQPITDFSKVDLGFGEEDKVDPDVLASFGKCAVEIGLTSGQAAKLARWQLNAVKEARERLVGQQTQILIDEWGKSARANVRQIGDFVGRLDRIQGLEGFSRAFLESGAGDSAVIMKAMLALAKMTGEAGVGRAAGAPAEKEETSLEFISRLYDEARAGRQK